MSPETLTVALSGVVVAILTVILLKREGEDSIANAGSRLWAALDSGKGFAWGVTLCGLFYLILQTIYGLRMPLADDEYAGAKAAYRMLELVPYRDFAPYKTVVGYYIQALPLLLTDNLWAGILLIRVEMAVINTLVLLFVAFRLRRHFSGSAICFALAMLVVMSTFVERSYVLRVDMLGSVCGLLSLVFLMERRAALAGSIAGLGFLISQKNVYFILAGGVALGGWWLWSLWRQHQHVMKDFSLDFDELDQPHAPPLGEEGSGPRPREAFFELAIYGSTVLAVLIVYFGFWSLVASFDQTVVRVFQRSASIAMADQPFLCSRDFWWQTLRRNPGFYGTAGIALVTLVPVVWRRHRYLDWLLLAYGSAITALCVWHKQPCPYFFVLLAPTLFVLTVALFDRMRKFDLTRPSTQGWTTRWRAMALLIFLSLGLFVPLSRLPRTLQRDNGFQSHTVALANHLLRPGDGYIASLPILYDRLQAVPDLSWLDDNKRHRLHRSSREELLEIASRMAQARIKLVIMNYRLEDLPPLLADYLVYHYAHFWGNVYLYAPYVGTGRRDFHIEFEGLYQVDLKGGPGPALIDDLTANHGQLVRLTQGKHRKSSREGLRLRFMPEDIDPALLQARYRQPARMFSYSFHY